MQLVDDEQPPESNAVGNSRQEFEERVFPVIAEDLGPASPELSRLSFYLGALTMLNIVQAVIENSEGEGATEIALDGLRDEVEGFIKASGDMVN